ncbi:hypothetical protein [Sulfuriroseicoccus oceanibius]|uniref:Uncharacterized protein n=1 Tax=Sulfuriroseicoccus oceanibius TaxID=2707525 RepID=A0A6B3L0X1_9BACT|nr:hypothetical protein [Sulfuriroseicoccus oceanibius]QQL46258.1 hypothetical protein G3M56_006700 [Sulfuriroseicoccus oceanibius]
MKAPNEKQRARLVRASRKAAKRQTVASREAVRSLRVQTVATWKRVVLAVAGVLLMSLAAVVYVTQGALVGAALIGTTGVGVLIFGVVGRKHSIDRAIRGLDASVSNQLIDAIFDQLG